jgi:hypothetical protein
MFCYIKLGWVTLGDIGLVNCLWIGGMRMLLVHDEILKGTQINLTNNWETLFDKIFRNRELNWNEFQNIENTNKIFKNCEKRLELLEKFTRIKW